MRDYQRRKNNKYYLPKSVYHRTLWVIRDYERMKEEAESMLVCGGAQNDGMPKGSNLTDRVADVAVKRCDLIREIEAIDLSLLDIPEEYRDGVWYNIQYNKPYPIGADRSTYGRYKSKFINQVARGLKLI